MFLPFLFFFTGKRLWKLTMKSAKRNTTELNMPAKNFVKIFVKSMELAEKQLNQWIHPKWHYRWEKSNLKNKIIYRVTIFYTEILMTETSGKIRKSTFWVKISSVWEKQEIWHGFLYIALWTFLITNVAILIFTKKLRDFLYFPHIFAIFDDFSEHIWHSPL